MKWKMLFIACLVASTIGVGAYRGSFLSTKSLWEDNLEPNFGLPLSHNGTIKVPAAPPIEDEGALPAPQRAIQPVGQPGVAQVGAASAVPAQVGLAKPAAQAGSQPPANHFQAMMIDCAKCECDAQRLADELREKRDPAKQAELRKKLEEVFDLRHAAQELEAQELSKKLNNLQKILAVRQQKRTEIVNTRVRDLIEGTAYHYPASQYPLAQSSKSETKVQVIHRGVGQAGPGTLAPLSNNSNVRNAEANRERAGSRSAGSVSQNKNSATATEGITLKLVAEQLSNLFRTLEAKANSLEEKANTLEAKANFNSAKYSNDAEVLKIELEKAKLEHAEAQVNADQQHRLSAQGVIGKEELRRCELAVQKAQLDVQLAEVKLKLAAEAQKAPPTPDNPPAKDKPTGPSRRSGSSQSSSGSGRPAQVVIVEHIQEVGPCPEESSFNDGCPFEAAQLSQKIANEKARVVQLRKLTTQFRTDDAARPSETKEGQGVAKPNPSVMSMGVRLPNPATRAPSVTANMSCAPSPTPTPKSVILIKSVVDEVKGKKIFLSDGTQCEAGAKTEIIQKTEDGEKKGKISDVKSGASIEVEMDKDTKRPKKITVSFMFSMAANNIG